MRLRLSWFLIASCCVTTSDEFQAVNGVPNEWYDRWFSSREERISMILNVRRGRGRGQCESVPGKLLSGIEFNYRMIRPKNEKFSITRN